MSIGNDSIIYCRCLDCILRRGRAVASICLSFSLRMCIA